MPDTNKCVLVTASSKGLGKAIAFQFAMNDYDIILHGRDEKKVRQTKELLENDSVEYRNRKIDVSCIVGDLRSNDTIDELYKISKGKISVLVNNAAMNPKMNKINKNSKTGTIENYSLSLLHKEIDVNLISAFAMIKHFGAEMAKNKKGSIINIGSDLSVNAPDQSVYSKKDNIKKVKNFKPIGYSISKFGIVGLTKYVATYWAHKNVRCNALIPGAVSNNQLNYLKKNVTKRIPLGRWARKDEYKKGLVFLAKNDSSYMTGQLLIMDGGRSTW